MASPHPAPPISPASIPHPRKEETHHEHHTHLQGVPHPRPLSRLDPQDLAPFVQADNPEQTAARILYHLAGTHWADEPLPYLELCEVYHQGTLDRPELPPAARPIRKWKSGKTVAAAGHKQRYSQDPDTF